MPSDQNRLHAICMHDSDVTASLKMAVARAQACMRDETVLCLIPKVLKPKLEQASMSLLQTGGCPVDVHLWKKVHFKCVPYVFVPTIFLFLIIFSCRYVLSSHSSTSVRADATGRAPSYAGHSAQGHGFTAHEVLSGWNEAADSHTVALLLIGADVMCGQARQHSVDVDVGSLYHLLSLAHTVPGLTSLTVSLALPARAGQGGGDAHYSLQALTELARRFDGRFV